MGTGKPPEADKAALSSKQQAQGSARPDSAKPFTLRAREAAGRDEQGVRALWASMGPCCCALWGRHTEPGKGLKVQKALGQWVKQRKLMGGPEAWTLKGLWDEMGHSVHWEVLGLVPETRETS